MNKRNVIMAAMSPVMAALLLAGCGKASDTNTSGSTTDTTVAKIEQKADDVKSSVGQKADDMKAGAQRGMEATKSAVDDAAITTSVKASLARDKDLSAMSINVDTSSGAVALHGTAPDPAAKDRATQIASAVKGVQSVDNQLTIKQ